MRAQSKNCKNTKYVLQHKRTSVTQDLPLHIMTDADVIAWDPHYENKKRRGQDGFLVLLLKHSSFDEYCSFLSNKSFVCKHSSKV